MFGDWAYVEPNFLISYPKFFSLKIFTLVLLDGFLDGFWKFWLFIVKICILIRYFWVFFENYRMHMLSIRGNDFIACWAYAEPISSHTEHRGTNFIACWAYAAPISLHAEYARKCLKVGWIEYNFQKSRVTGPWDHMVSVSAKEVKKKVSCLCTFKSLKIRTQALSPFTHSYVFWRTLVAKAEMYCGRDRAA